MIRIGQSWRVTPAGFFQHSATRFRPFTKADFDRIDRKVIPPPLLKKVEVPADSKISIPKQALWELLGQIKNNSTVFTSRPAVNVFRSTSVANLAAKLLLVKEKRDSVQANLVTFSQTPEKISLHLDDIGPRLGLIFDFYQAAGGLDETYLIDLGSVTRPS